MVIVIIGLVLIRSALLLACITKPRMDDFTDDVTIDQLYLSLFIILDFIALLALATEVG